MSISDRVSLCGRAPVVPWSDGTPGRVGWLGATAALLATTSLLALGTGTARAGDEPAAARAAAASTEVLLKKLDAMEQRIRTLEGQLKRANAAPASPAAMRSASAPPPAARAASGPFAEAAPPADAKPAPADPKVIPASAPETPARKPILGLADSPIPGLSIGAYGEFFFGAQQNPAAGGQWQSGFDARRFVLLPAYQITDNIIFNAEIEFEHAGSGFDNDDKLHGTAEIEQLWIDFKIVDQFNWRAPGIDLVPIGYINQHHEPTQFYSVNRPELYNGLIPSTWKVPGSQRLRHDRRRREVPGEVSASLEDFGDEFDARTEAKTAPPFRRALRAPA